jgi:hypothetical protein
MENMEEKHDFMAEKTQADENAPQEALPIDDVAVEPRAAETSSSDPQIPAWSLNVILFRQVQYISYYPP